jgi:hypothetical protein
MISEASQPAGTELATSTDSWSSNAASAGRPWSIKLALLIVALSPAFLPVTASGQSRPAAPDLICIEESGGCNAPVVAANGNVKWNPGHYIKTQGHHAQGDIADYVDAINRQLDKTGDSPEIRGAQIHYGWGMIEKSPGNYDFGPIRNHLEYLADRGKRMILVIDTKCFRSTCPTLAPADLMGEVFLTPRANPTHIVEIWEERNMSRLIALWRALGAEFDDHPALEMVLGSESAPSLQGGNPANYSRSEYAKQLKRMYVAQAEAFPRTNVVANINFLTNQLSGMMETAYQAGAGRGMPDIGNSNGSLIFRGQCKNSDCGVRDYRGLVPHLGIVSAPILSEAEGETNSPDKAIDFGVANDITHYAWVSSMKGEDSWENILRAINTTFPNAHLTCPKVYQGRCQ